MTHRTQNYEALSINLKPHPYLPAHLWDGLGWALRLILGMVFTDNPLPGSLSAREDVLESGRLTALREEGRCMAEREEGRLPGARDDTLDRGDWFGLTRPLVSMLFRFSMLEAGRRVLLD